MQFVVFLVIAADGKKSSVAAFYTFTQKNVYGLRSYLGQYEHGPEKTLSGLGALGDKQGGENFDEIIAFGAPETLSLDHVFVGPTVI